MELPVYCTTDSDKQEQCPLRQVRSFCVVRVRDSTGYDIGMEAQLTIWDYAAIGEPLQTGARYWVSPVWVSLTTLMLLR